MLTKFTDLERDVIGKLLQGDSPTLAILRSQIELADFKRHVTGAGFYLDFTVPKNCGKVTPNTFRIGDVTATLPGLQYGAGFVLFVKDGYARQLEGYTYEESWPKEILTYELSFQSEPRNISVE